MQLYCSGCGGSLNLTDQRRKPGSVKCPYCGVENNLPEEMSAHDERPAKPKYSNIRHKRSENNLEIHIGPKGENEFSNSSVKEMGLFFVFAAGSLVAGFYFNRALWIAAVIFAFFSYNKLKAVAHPYFNHRRICINADRFIYEQYDRLPGIGLRLWRQKREFAISRLRSIRLRTMNLKALHDPVKILVMNFGKRLEILGYSPGINSNQELRWLDYEIHDFLMELDRKRNRSGQSSIPASRRDAVSVSHGIDLCCFSCGSPVELSAETIMKRAARCNHCGNEVIVRHPIRPGLLATNEKFEHAEKKTGTPVKVHLAKNSMKIEVPPRGFTEVSISNLLFNLMLAISMAVVGYVLVEQGYLQVLRGLDFKSSEWLFPASFIFVVLFFIFLIFLISFLQVFKSVFGSATITIDRVKCTISRRLLGRTRHVSYKTGDIVRAIYDTGHSRESKKMRDASIYCDLVIEIKGTYLKKNEKLVYADFGDDWQWIADEINAFKASLEAAVTSVPGQLKK